MMKKNLLTILVVVIALLSACVDGGGGDSNDIGKQDPPTDTCTVKFNLDGGKIDGATTLADAKVTKGSSLGDQYPNPTREGSWLFGGWFDESVTPHEQYQADTPINKNLTLKAKWTSTDTNKWVVTFDTDGGTPASIESIQVTKGESMGGQYPTDPTKARHEFEGWYLASDASFSGTKYEKTTAITANTDLKAKWKSTDITIVIEMEGEEDGDSVTATPESGQAGEEITINYTLAGTKHNNRLSFSGTDVEIEEVDTAETGTRTYTITASDATDGVITIIATFAHSNKELDTIAFADNVGVEKTYGDDPYTKAITTNGSGTGAITYASSDETVATVNITTGEVTILKAGNTTITATKTEDTTYAEATASYLLTVEKLQLVIGTPTITPKQYDGNATATVTPGSLTNKIGSDTVNVHATGTYTSANAGSGITITVFYTIDGEDAGNYIAPVEGTATGSITKANGADVNTNPTAAAKSDTTITSSVVTVSGSAQTVEYAISTAASPEPASGWQDGLLFKGLTDSTDYYIFARSKGDSNYNTGTAKVSSKITTDAPLVIKYNFGAGDTIPVGYPQPSGNISSASIVASNATAGNFFGKQVLRIQKPTGNASPKFILPFDIGSKTLADYAGIVIVARVSGAPSNVDHNNKIMIAHVGGTTVLGQTVNNGFNLGNSVNDNTVAVFIPITLGTANTYSGKQDIGFLINNVNALDYEILGISLLPSSLGYDFGAGDTIPVGYPQPSGNISSASIVASNATAGNFFGKQVLRIQKPTGNASPKFILPFDIGSKTLADYAGIVIVARVSGAPSNVDHNNKIMIAHVGGTTVLGQTVNNGFNLGNSVNDNTVAVFIPITLGTANTYSGKQDIGFLINNVNALDYEILGISLLP
jgi:hypothetical protein